MSRGSTEFARVKPYDRRFLGLALFIATIVVCLLSNMLVIHFLILALFLMRPRRRPKPVRFY
jgi:hypothetical protein